MTRAKYVSLLFLIVGSGLLSWVRAVGRGERPDQNFLQSKFRSSSSIFDKWHFYRPIESISEDTVQGGNDNNDIMYPGDRLEASQQHYAIDLTQSSSDEAYREADHSRTANAGSLSYILNSPTVSKEHSSLESFQSSSGLESYEALPDGQPEFENLNEALSKASHNQFHGRFAEVFRKPRIYSSAPSFSVEDSSRLLESMDEVTTHDSIYNNITSGISFQASTPGPTIMYREHQRPLREMMRPGHHIEASKKQHVIDLTESDSHESREPGHSQHANAGSLSYILHPSKVFHEPSSVGTSKTSDNLSSLGTVPEHLPGYMSVDKPIFKGINHSRGRFANESGREHRRTYRATPNAGKEWSSTDFQGKLHGPHGPISQSGMEEWAFKNVQDTHLTLESEDTGMTGNFMERGELPGFSQLDSRKGSYAPKVHQREISQEHLLEKLTRALLVEDRATLVSLLLQRNDSKFFSILRGAMLSVLDNGLNPEKWPSQLIQLILQHGADANISPHKQPLIHVAATLGDTEVLQLLLNHGVFVDKLYGNKTPLQRAIEEGHLEAAQLLVRYGADLDRPLHKNTVFTLADLASASNGWHLR